MSLWNDLVFCNKLLQTQQIKNSVLISYTVLSLKEPCRIHFNSIEYIHVCTVAAVPFNMRTHTGAKTLSIFKWVYF